MIDIVAVALITFGIMQMTTGIATIIGKFDPLLPQERKKLPSKFRKEARMLNAVSMIATSVIFYILGIGMLLGFEILQVMSAILMAVFVPVMLIISIKIETKHLRK